MGALLLLLFYRLGNSDVGLDQSQTATKWWHQKSMQAVWNQSWFMTYTLLLVDSASSSSSSTWGLTRNAE